MTHGYTYEGALAASERVNWRVQDIIGAGKRLDFSRPFLPDSLARTEPLTFLTPDERLALNQIRANEYIHLFGLIEQFILPFVLDHTRPQLHGDNNRVRALLNFANEEAKHIQLFRRFKMELERGFGTRCEVIGSPGEVTRAVLSHHPLAVALTILHIEWMTQCHYDTVKDDHQIDPRFKSLLEHHWMEEAQHAELDTLMIDSLRESCTDREIRGSIEEYLRIGGMLDGALERQVELNLKSFTHHTGRSLTESELETYLAVQRQGLRWTYLGSGMTHENFLTTVGELDPEARRQIERLAPVFC